MEEIVRRIKSTFGNRFTDWEEKPGRRIYFRIDPRHVVDLAQFLFNDLRARFTTASGIDQKDTMEILYHFSFDKFGYVVSAKVRIPKKKLEVESITPVIRGAEWIEREMWELLGITFKNHPDMRHLLLKDDWPEGKYPLRRDYEGLDT